MQVKVFSDMLTAILIDWLIVAIIDKDYRYGENNLPSSDAIRILSFVCKAINFALFKPHRDHLERMSCMALRHILTALQDQELDYSDRFQVAQWIVGAIGPTTKHHKINVLVSQFRAI